MPPHNQHPENGPLEELTPEALLAGAYRDGGEAAYAAELQRQQVEKLYTVGGNAAVAAFFESQQAAQATAERADSSQHPTPDTTAPQQEQPRGTFGERTTPRQPRDEHRAAASRPQERATAGTERPPRPQQPERGEPRDARAEVMEKAKFWAKHMPRDRMLFMGKLREKEFMPFAIAGFQSDGAFEQGRLNPEAAKDSFYDFASLTPWSGENRNYPESVYSTHGGHDWNVIKQPNDNERFCSVAYLFTSHTPADERLAQGRFVASIPTRLWGRFVEDIVKHPDLMRAVWEAEVLEKIEEVKKFCSQRINKKVGTFIVDSDLCDPYNLYVTNNSTLFNPHGDRRDNWKHDFSSWKGLDRIPNLEQIVRDLSNPKEPTIDYMLEETGKIDPETGASINILGKSVGSNGRTKVSVKDTKGVVTETAVVYAPRKYKVEW